MKDIGTGMLIVIAIIGLFLAFGYALSFVVPAAGF